MLGLKEVTINGIKSTYKDFIIACLNFVQQDKGIKIDEQRKRIRILDAVENANGLDIIFEDADAAELTVLVDNMVWAIFSKDVVAFVDDVKNMKSL